MFSYHRRRRHWYSKRTHSAVREHIFLLPQEEEALVLAQRELVVSLLLVSLLLVSLLLVSLPQEEEALVLAQREALTSLAACERAQIEVVREHIL